MASDQTVSALYSCIDFEALLEDARQNARSEWDEDFITDLYDRWTKFGTDMFLSALQQEQLERIAGQ